MVVHITLPGSKEDQFETLKSEFEAELGYRLNNPEVVGILMGMYPESEE